MVYKPEFVEGEVYHVYNRGVEKRKTFLDKDDYLRFIYDLFEFNSDSPAINNFYYFDPKIIEVEPHYFLRQTKVRNPYVEILLFTLMPNHYHLLVQQKVEHGITYFMQKLGTGYTMYFNKKYKRVGGLFQGRFKAVRVSNEEHFMHLPFYIHSNPLKLFKKYQGSTSIQQLSFLENYRWSSHRDYLEKDNFPYVTSRNFLLEFFGGTKNYKKSISNWLKERESYLDKFKEVIIEDFND